MATGVCSVIDCGRATRVVGLCQTHYDYKRHGRPLKALRSILNPLPLCPVSGCTKPIISRGYCYNHYANFKRCGNPLGAGKRNATPLPPCSMGGCHRLAISLKYGLCGLHDGRKRRWGDPSVSTNPHKTIHNSPSLLARRLGVTRQRAEQILNRDKHHARQAVARAVESGKLIKPKVCMGCAKRTTDLEAHHSDYKLPLLVVWVCPPCHGVIHPRPHKTYQPAGAA